MYSTESIALLNLIHSLNERSRFSQPSSGYSVSIDTGIVPARNKSKNEKAGISSYCKGYFGRT